MFAKKSGLISEEDLEFDNVSGGIGLKSNLMKSTAVALSSLTLLSSSGIKTQAAPNHFVGAGNSANRSVSNASAKNLLKAFGVTTAALGSLVVAGFIIDRIANFSGGSESKKPDSSPKPVYTIPSPPIPIVPIQTIQVNQVNTSSSEQNKINKELKELFEKNVEMFREQLQKLKNKRQAIGDNLERGAEFDDLMRRAENDLSNARLNFSPLSEVYKRYVELANIHIKKMYEVLNQSYAKATEKLNNDIEIEYIGSYIYNFEEDTLWNTWRNNCIEVCRKILKNAKIEVSMGKINISEIREHQETILKDLRERAERERISFEISKEKEFKTFQEFATKKQEFITFMKENDSRSSDLKKSIGELEAKIQQSREQGNDKDVQEKEAALKEKQEELEKIKSENNKYADFAIKCKDEEGKIKKQIEILDNEIRNFNTATNSILKLIEKTMEFENLFEMYMA